jgi:hypothetical protein
MNRRLLLTTVTILFLGGIAALLTVAVRPELLSTGKVTVVHWAAGELMNERLLPKMAADFAAQRRKTASGKQIEVKPALVNSGRQAEVLSQSALRGLLTDTTLEPPTIVTPSVSTGSP